MDAVSPLSHPLYVDNKLLALFQITPMIPFSLSLNILVVLMPSFIDCPLIAVNHGLSTPHQIVS